MSENMFCPAHKSNSKKYQQEYNRVFNKKSITVWYKMNKEGEWEHNHIEDGWNFSNMPISTTKLQEISWANNTWKKEFGLMLDGKVEKNG